MLEYLREADNNSSVTADKRQKEMENAAVKRIVDAKKDIAADFEKNFPRLLKQNTTISELIGDHQPFPNLKEFLKSFYNSTEEKILTSNNQILKHEKLIDAQEIKIA